MSLLSLLLWHITSGDNKQGWSVYRREENIDDAERGRLSRLIGALGSSAGSESRQLNKVY